MSKSRNNAPSFIGQAIMAAIFAAIAYAMKPQSVEMEWMQAIFAFSAGYIVFRILRQSAKHIYNWLSRRMALTPTNNYGSAHWASDKEIKRAGLFKTDGVFLGLSANSGWPMFGDFTHGLTLAMAGGWKTVCFVVCVLMHYPTSIIVTDPKGTLACITKWVREKIFGHKTYFFNLGGRYLKILGKSARYNPLNPIIIYWKNGQSGGMISLAQGLAHQFLPEPPKAGENTFFRNGSRSLLTFCFLYIVFFSEKKTLSAVLKLLRNEPVLKDALAVAACSDVLRGDLADRANDLFQQISAADDRQWQSFRSGAVQVMEDFSEGSELAEATSTCDFTGKELKNEKVSLYLISDPSKQKAHGKCIAAVLWALKQEMMMEQNTKPVLFLLDEAANFPIHGISESLTFVREFGIKIWFVLQDLEQYANVYGRGSLETMLSQTDCKQIFGVQSHKTAELVSKMLGDTTVKQINYALGHNKDDLVQHSASEIARPLLKADEVRRFGDMIILYKDLPPIHGLKCGYHEINPWFKWARPNPMHGNKRFKGKIKLWLKY